MVAAKIVFSIGTQTVRRRPVRTASCKVKRLQAIVAARNHAAAAGVPTRDRTSGTQIPAPKMKTDATAADISTVAPYEPRISLVVVRPAVGMKRVSAPARPSWERYERNIMVEISAAFTPTSSAL